MLLHLPAQEQTLLILIQLGEGFLVGEFLAAGLNREVGLAGGNDRLARVAVLNDQVAGITGEGDVLKLPCLKTEDSP